MKNLYYQLNSDSYIQDSQSFNMNSFYNFVEPLLNKKDNILDIGFGSGRDMLYFKSKGFNIKGIDNCSNFVEYGLKLGLNVSKETLPNLNLEEKFDLIYSVGVIFHLNKEDRLKLFNNIKKLLKNNGKLVLSYNTLDRTSDTEREFFKVSEKEINEETGLILINSEIMKDAKRDFYWITSVYSK